MNCSLCGRQAEPDAQTGAPPDDYCPECKPFEEAHEILTELHTLLEIVEAAGFRVQEDIDGRVASTNEDLRLLHDTAKAIKAITRKES